MKKDYCEKCKKYLIVQEHHILPQSTFGKTKETIKLCPNCHTDYHNSLGSKNLKNPDMEFHFEKFYRWLAGLSIVLLLVYFLF
jgi:hypothetical protein